MPSRVALMKHPLHPMTVHFPIALLTCAPLADMAFWLLADPFWAQAAFWLIAGGLVSGIVAAGLGTAEFLLVPAVRLHVTGWSHFIAGIMTVALSGANLALRLPDPVGAALPWGLTISLFTVVLVGCTGYLGGTLTFHHGIGTHLDQPAADQAGTADDDDPARK